MSDGAKPLWAMTRREAELHLRAEAGLPPLRRRKWIPVMIAVLGVMVAGTAYVGMRDAGTPAAVTVEIPDPRIEILLSEYEQVASRDLVRTITVFGDLAPARTLVLSSEIGGRAIEVEAKEGQPVAQGDILLTIDTRSLNADLAAAQRAADATRAQIGLAEESLARSEALRARGVETKAAYQQAEVNLAIQKANLASQEEQIRAIGLMIEKATVRAPFSGTISSRSVDPGQVVAAGSSLFTIVDTANLEMVAAAPVDADISLVDPALVTPGKTDSSQTAGAGKAPSSVTRTANAAVARINPVATAGTRTLPVYLTVPNGNGELRAGIHAKAVIETDRRPDSIALPASALRRDDEGLHVLRIDDGRLERVAVSADGPWDGNLWSITDGLKPGDLVITAPLPDLEAGALVILEGLRSSTQGQGDQPLRDVTNTGGIASARPADMIREN